MENRGGVGWGCSVFLMCVHPPVFKVRLAPPRPSLPLAFSLSLPLLFGPQLASRGAH